MIPKEKHLKNMKSNQIMTKRENQKKPNKNKTNPKKTKKTT